MRVSGRRTVALLVILAGCSSSPRPATNQDAGTAPILVVEGDGVAIADGASPAAGTGTDFGVVGLSMAPVVHTFSILNSGTGDLTIDSIRSDGAAFVILTPPAGAIAAGASATFDVQFAPSAAGEVTAQVAVASNGGSVTFGVQGVGGTPKLALAGYGHPIAAAAAASTELGTDFGVVRAGAVAIVRRVTVRNSGGDVLQLGPITVSGPGFAVVGSPPATVAPGESTTFALSFTAPAAGESDGEVTVMSSDASQSPFTFAVRGRQSAGTPLDVALDDTPPSGSTVLTYPAMVSLSGHGTSDVLMLYWSYPSGTTQPRVYENDGAGHLTDATAAVFGASPPTMNGPHRYAVADFDGDGRLDVFVAENGADASPWPGAQNTLLLQKTAGQLVDASGNLPALTALNYAVSAGDIDGDGATDLWIGDVYCQSRALPHFMRNDGMARFTDVTNDLPALLDYQAQGGHQFYGAAIVDVNLDGFADLVLGAQSAGMGNDLSSDVVLLGDGQRFVQSANATPSRLGGAAATTEFIASADFNNDGWPDLVVSTHVNYDKGAIQLLINNGDGTFRDATSELPMTDWSADYWSGTATQMSHWFYSLVPVDIDGDGRMDLVTEGNLIYSATLQQGPQGFTQARLFDQPNAAGHTPYWVQPADMDGDGIADYLILATTP